MSRRALPRILAPSCRIAHVRMRMRSARAERGHECPHCYCYLSDSVRKSSELVYRVMR